MECRLLVRALLRFLCFCFTARSFGFGLVLGDVTLGVSLALLRLAFSLQVFPTGDLPCAMIPRRIAPMPRRTKVHQ
jgi:hypothetical protein